VTATNNAQQSTNKTLAQTVQTKKEAIKDEKKEESKDDAGKTEVEVKPWHPPTKGEKK
jgi:hypothetical protein